MRQIKLLITALLVLPFAANAVPIPDAEDTDWQITGTPVTFFISHVSGSLAANAALQFGVYRISDMATTVIFNNGYSSGDFAMTSSFPGMNDFGFFLRNTSNLLGGPVTFYSDSSLNPGGLDAMTASFAGLNTWVIEFEDWGAQLPINPPADLRVIVGNIAMIPEPGTLALMGLGLFGMGLFRRQQKS